MPVTISYDGQVLTPTPFLSESERAAIDGTSLYKSRSFELNGFVTGDIQAAKDSLLTVFSNDFRLFEANGDDISISQQNCIVRSINFQPSRSFGAGSYSISLECFGDGTLGDIGVTNPVNEWSINENQDGTVIINHKISANGLNDPDGNNAYTAAKSFVENLRGVGTFIPARFIRNASNIIPTDSDLFSITKNINNAAGSYGIDEVYKISTKEGVRESVFTTYNIDVNQGIGEDFKTVNLSVTQECSPDSEIVNFLLTEAALYNFATTHSAVANLNTNPISFDFNVTNKNKSQYRVSYTDSEFITFFDFNQSFSYDNVSQETNIDINGVIKSKGHLAQRWLNVNTFYNDKVSTFTDIEGYCFSLASSFYSDVTNGGPSYTLNPKSTRLSSRFNEYNGEIEIAASFSDKDFLHQNFADSNYSVDIQMPLRIILPRASCMVNGLYKMYDSVIASRARVSTRVAGTSKVGVASAEPLVAGLLVNLEGVYVSPSTDLVLENENKSIATGSLSTIAYNREQSFDGLPVLFISPSYQPVSP